MSNALSDEERELTTVTHLVLIHSFQGKHVHLLIILINKVELFPLYWCTFVTQLNVEQECSVLLLCHVQTYHYSQSNTALTNFYLMYSLY